MLVIREEQMQELSKNKTAPETGSETASDEQNKAIFEGKTQDDFYKLPIKKGTLCHWEWKKSGNTVMNCSSDKPDKKLKLTVKAYIDLTGEPIDCVQFAIKSENSKGNERSSLTQIYLYDDIDKELKYETNQKGECKDIELKPGEYALKVIHIITIEKNNGNYERVDEPSLPLDKNYILMNISKNLIKISECYEYEIILYYKKLGCIIDAHMHVMSGKCATIPMTGKKTKDKLVRVEKDPIMLGKALSYVFDLGISNKQTKDIAKKALKHNHRTYERFKTKFSEYKNCELFTPMVVLTVDFEYAHIKGYEGKTIYRQKKSNKERSEAIYDDVYYQNYYGEENQVEVSYKNDKGKTKKAIIVNEQYEKEALFEEAIPFEPWQEQLKQTIQVVKENPWKLIPFFFYEPRRWLKDTTWLEDKKCTLWENLPLEEVATKDRYGLFVGFKMYTPYGVKPLDPNLLEMKTFYEECQKQSIPIMNHCTPSGTYTHERELYLWEDKGVVGDGNAKLEYFNDNFVSPSAWEEVLKEYQNLKLCLAHVGGNPSSYEKEYDNSKWVGKIYDFCITYPNFYTDVSDVFHIQKDREFVKKAILKGNKRIFYKVMFGTDWYVTKYRIINFDFDYKLYCGQSKKFLDELTKKFQEAKVLTKEEDLWTLFTLVNPFRYLGFVDENAEVNTKLINNIAVGLLCDNRVEQVSVNKDELKKNTDIIMKTAQSVSKYLKKRLALIQW